MYIWGKGRAAGRVGSDFLSAIVGRVGSGRVNVSPGRVGSKKSDPWTTLFWTGKIFFIVSYSAIGISEANYPV